MRIFLGVSTLTTFEVRSYKCDTMLVNCLRERGVKENFSFPGSDIVPDDPYWGLGAHHGDIILRTKRYMASEQYDKCLVYLPAEVAKVRAPVGLPASLAPKNPITDDYKSHISKYLPILRQHGLERASDHLDRWMSDTLELKPLLDVSATLGEKTCHFDLFGNSFRKF